MSITVLAFHGGTFRGGAIEIRPPRRGRAEGGPGFYATSSYLEAKQRYGGGGRAVSVLEIDLGEFVGPTRYLRTVPIADVIAFIRDAFPRRIASESVAFMKDRHSTDEAIDPVSVVNLAVNAEIASNNAVAMALRKFMVSHDRPYDISAGSHGRERTETIVIYDPAIVKASAAIPGDFFDKISDDPARRFTPTLSQQVEGAPEWAKGVEESLRALVLRGSGARVRPRVAAAPSMDA